MDRDKLSELVDNYLNDMTDENLTAFCGFILEHEYIEPVDLDFVLVKMKTVAAGLRDSQKHHKWVKKMTDNKSWVALCSREQILNGVVNNPVLKGF